MENRRHHKRTFTGYGPNDMKKELSKWRPEVVELWEKCSVPEAIGMWFIVCIIIYITYRHYQCTKAKLFNVAFR